MLRTEKIKKLFESCGSNVKQREIVFIKKLKEMLTGDKDHPALLQPDDISIKALYEAVGSASFPIIMATVLSKQIILGYDAGNMIGKKLVTEFKSNMDSENVPGMTATGTIRRIYEKGNYPHTAGMDEKYIPMGHEKFGEILDISEEAIKFDRTGLLMMAAKEMGSRLADKQEQIILNTIQDIAGYYAWYPQNTRVAMYSTSTTAPHIVSNQITNNLADFTDLDAAKVLFFKMTDDDSKAINVMPKILLVPGAKDTTARRLIGNTVLPGGANAEKNPFSGAYEVLASPYLDAQSAIVWYLGDFKKQFLWKTVTPLQVLSRVNAKDDADWNRDIKYQYKVRFDGLCRARDFRYVVKSTGAA